MKAFVSAIVFLFASVSIACAPDANNMELGAVWLLNEDQSDLVLVTCGDVHEFMGDIARVVELDEGDCESISHAGKDYIFQCTDE